MNNKFTAIFIGLLALIIVNKANAAPVSSSIVFNSFASLQDFGGSSPDTDQMTDNGFSTWGTLLDPLSVTVGAAVSDATQSLVVSGSASATWGTGGNSGHISFQNFGWSGNVHHFSADLRNGFDNNIWSYTFIADNDGVFSMSYDTSVVDAISPFGPSGLRGWDIEWIGSGGGLSLMAPDPTANGVFSRSIVAGQVYTVGLRGGPSAAFGSSETHHLSQHVQGEFNFSIVSEPPSIILFALGLIMLVTIKKKGDWLEGYQIH